jgi:hypothetical protein
LFPILATARFDRDTKHVGNTVQGNLAIRGRRGYQSLQCLHCVTVVVFVFFDAMDAFF